MGYKNGTRVIGVKSFEGKSIIIGVTGTIISQLRKDLYCIQYDKDICGHSGGSRDMNTHKYPKGEYDHCWNTRVGYFKLFNMNRRME
jgi:hypothetical protein